MSRHFRLLVGLSLAASALAARAAGATSAQEILSATGVKGGLVVHVGCGDGKLTAALRGSGSYMVHGIDRDAANVAKARAHIQSRGLYGQVAVDRWTGKSLPYIDNLVNLVVASGKGQVSSEEIARVLAPRGKALVRSGSLDTRPGRRRPALTLDPQAPSGLAGWSLFTKPVPREIDDWTHYLYDASNNAVSHDTAVAPPRHFQWIGSPRYSRHHDHMSGASAMASVGGRLFYIFDHASPMSPQLPSVWRLTARDAFNGTVLWERPIAKWHTQMFRLKSGPAQLTRRLVAIGDIVYVTLGLEAPVSALDTVTGKTLLAYKGSAGAEELIVHDGVVFAMINDKPFRQPANPREYNYNWPEGPRRIAAYEAATGKLLWSEAQPTVLPLTLCADARRVIFHDGQKVACLDRKTGKDLWRSQPLGWRRPLPTSFVPTLVLYRGVVLFSGGGKANQANRFRPEGNVIYGLSADDGKELWNAPHPPSGHRTAQDTLVVGGLVWTPTIAHGSDSGEMIGRDPRTGEVKKKFLPDVETHWFHHRCHRAKATDKYLLTSRTGIEFVDPETGHWECHHWVRGGCLYGIMPANGMIYNPPHPCACYLEAKLYGYNALAPARKGEGRETRDEQTPRLERGPAYGSSLDTRHSTLDTSADWPTYRHDPARSGSTKTAVPTELTQAWSTKLGGRLSSVTVAEGKLFVASIDTHTVHALDAVTGKPAWAFTAGGRVDSPPTIWQGRALFGCADGYVYCLRAADGALAWRFRAAPMDLRMGAFEQLESVWPVPGSVLIREGVLWCVAGRSMFVDGGLRLVRLNPKTGDLVAEDILDDRVPGSDKNLQVVMKGLNMAVALPDVLSYDGKYVYMRSQRFDQDGKRQEIEVPNLDARQQKGESAHLFCPTGFLDDIWWHRSYWVFGRVWKSGAGGYHQAGRNAPSGRPMVFDDTQVYSYGRKPQYYRWTTPMEYMLFASAKQPEILRTKPEAAPKKRAAKKAPRKKGGLGSRPMTRFATHWTQDVPVLARAMVLADRTLFFAGPPDLVDEEASLRAFDQSATQKLLARQAAALGGAEGALLWAVSTDGKKLAERKLDVAPVFDGMAAARGRLYMATVDGKIICFAKGR